MNRVEFVCYTSKLCNLRCRYCYEYPMLGDRNRMSLEQIGRMFENIRSYYQTFPRPIEIHFQWHGGEPLLIPPHDYRRIFEVQRQVFAGSSHRVTNGLQSNLTVIDDDRIALLRDEFETVGVSLDLFTDLRVDRRGMSQEGRALANLDRVRAAGVAVSGITVLSRPNLSRVEDIYRFYRDRGMGFRLLPLGKGLYEPGGFEITPAEILEALCTLADLWLVDDQPMEVQPLRGHLTLAVFARLNPANRVAIYDKRISTSPLLVDTDGSVSSYGDRFDPSRSAGNLFEAPLGELLRSPAFLAAAGESRMRMSTCQRCPFFGRACGGDPLGESQQAFIDLNEDGTLRCVVAYGLLRHLQRRLGEGYIGVDRLRETLSILQSAEAA